MQRKARPADGRGAQAAVEVEALPAREDLRLLLRQSGAHGEIGLGQEQRLAVVAPLGRLLGHAAPSNKGVPQREAFLRARRDWTPRGADAILHI